jgi:predicted nucleic acid-binding protein
MSEPFVDTDVIIRLITGDDPVKQTAAETLFRQVANGTITLRAPDTVIADAVYVLASPNLYRRNRSHIRDQLGYLLRLQNFKVHNKRLLLRALDVFAGTSLDFGDAMLVATMRRRGSSDLYSYDHDFDHVTGIRRVEP